MIDLKFNLKLFYSIQFSFYETTHCDPLLFEARIYSLLATPPLDAAYGTYIDLCKWAIVHHTFDHSTVTTVIVMRAQFKNRTWGHPIRKLVLSLAIMRLTTDYVYVNRTDGDYWSYSRYDVFYFIVINGLKPFLTITN